MLNYTKKLFRITLISGLICFYAGVSLILFIWWYANWSEEDVAETKKIGNEIKHALATYKDDNGLYPEKLSLLVPKYIDAIEQPLVGNEQWSYSITNNKYSLMVYGKNKLGDPWLGTSSDYKSWSYDTAWM